MHKNFARNFCGGLKPRPLGRNFWHPKNPPVKAGVRTNPACSETKFLAHQKRFAFLSALGRGRTPAADFYDFVLQKFAGFQKIFSGDGVFFPETK